jgi:hypothetical protein
MQGQLNYRHKTKDLKTPLFSAWGVANRTAVLQAGSRLQAASNILRGSLGNQTELSCPPVAGEVFILPNFKEEYGFGESRMGHEEKKFSTSS